jgi:hypothetical protein
VVDATYLYFAVRAEFQNVSVACLAAYSRAFGSPMPGLRESGREADRSATPRAKIKNE